MKDTSQRRAFINKLLLGGTTLVSAPFVALSKSMKEETSQTSEKPEDTRKPIIKSFSLGFQWDTLDPFLFCVHHEDKFPKGNDQMGPAISLKGRHIGDDFIIKDGFRMYHGDTVPGFPRHPHRGFETVTIVREGFVDHSDSLGAAGRYGQGDVQWMTAGKGVQHAEMFPLLHRDKENPMELFQIWLNLPKKNKMVDAHFKMLWSENIPKYVHTDDKGKTTKVEVIAGTLDKYSAVVPPPDSWAADPANEVAIWNIRMEPNAHWVLPKASPGINRTIYYYTGDSISIANELISGYHAVVVHADMDIDLQNGNTKGRLLVLQGRPINEPVIQYGPFVMNTKAEINQAFEDYHHTQFGGWPWPKSYQVHDRNAGRFALHADGRKETKG